MLISFAEQDEKMPIDVNVSELKPLKNFGDGPPGSGSMLALKLLLQTLDNIILVNSTGTMTPFINGMPFVHAGPNAASVARGVSQSGMTQNASSRGEKGMEKKPGTKVVAFAGDGATAMNLASIANVKEDVLYVCANDFGYNAMNYKSERALCRHVAGSASYAATASVAHPEDYIVKLKKAHAMAGFRFIEVLCPSPESWGYEPSNTIEVGRVAVETGLWPLFEVENSVVTITKRPNRLEPVESFNHVQKKFQIPSDKVQSVQEHVNRSWKMLGDGRLL